VSRSFLILAVAVLAAGCHDPKAQEVERLRAEAEASRAEAARARAEADLARAELVQALADAQVVRAELARLRGEPVATVTPRLPAPDAGVPLEQRFLKLKASYDKGEILSNEWTQLKTKVIDGIPAEVPAAEKRTLGQRLIDLKSAYDGSALLSGEWAAAKTKVIAQKPAAGRLTASLDRELEDLKKAYDGGAVLSSEWAQAKAEVTKWAK
jgi:hypothetical protein